MYLEKSLLKLAGYVLQLKIVFVFIFVFVFTDIPTFQ